MKIFPSLIVPFLLLCIDLFGQVDCEINPADFEFSMTITGSIEIEDLDFDNEIVVLCFNNDECRGNASQQYLQELDQYIVFLTVYSNASTGDTINFNVYDTSLNNLYDIPISLEFQPGLNLGTVSSPYIFTNEIIDPDIILTNSAIDENLPVGSLVGELSFIPYSSGENYTFSLISGEGDTDNSFFEISAENLITNMVFDFEEQSQYQIRVKATVNESNSIEKAFIIDITNVNETPTSISLSSDTISEGQSIGTLIGTFSSVDPDIGDEVTFSLTQELPDNSSFTIQQNELRSAIEFIYTENNRYTIQVKAEDIGGSFLTQYFDIQINIETSSIELFTLGDVEMTLYPNPAQNAIKISSSVTIDQLTIYNVTGSLVKIEFPAYKEFEIFLGDFIPGTYVVNMQTDFGTINRKVVISPNTH